MLTGQNQNILSGFGFIREQLYIIFHGIDENARMQLSTRGISKFKRNFSTVRAHASE